MTNEHHDKQTVWVPVFTDRQPILNDRSYINKWGRRSYEEAERVYAEGLSEGWISSIVSVTITECKSNTCF